MNNFWNNFKIPFWIVVLLLSSIIFFNTYSKNALKESETSFTFPTRGETVSIIGDRWAYDGELNSGWVVPLQQKTGWVINKYIYQDAAFCSESSKNNLSMKLDEFNRKGSALIIWQLGNNENLKNQGCVKKKAEETILKFLNQNQNVELVLIGPLLDTEHLDKDLIKIDEIFNEISNKLGIIYISPMGKNWINADNNFVMLNSSSNGLSPMGSQEIAEQIMNSFWEISIYPRVR